MNKSLKELWHDHRMLLIVTSCIILLQMPVGIAIWDKLPDPIATHFGFNGEPDGWTSKATTVFGMPLVLLAMHWICLLVSCTKGQIRNDHSKIKYVLLFIVPATSLLMMVVCYGYSLGVPMNVGRIALVFVGVLFAVTGNYMPKIRRNYFTGIKLPWTIDNDENWNKTHRMAAPVWVVCGIVLMVFGLIGNTTWTAFIPIAVAVFLPTAYSFALHMKMK